MSAIVGCPKGLKFGLNPRGLRGPSNGSRTVMAASRPSWLPGTPPPAHLNGTLAGDFGWDPLGLGANPDALKWFRESELQHARWAMLGTAGIFAQELVRPDVFWYEAATKVDLPFNPLGLLAFELFAMHYVEVRRGQDLKKPGSVNQDPIFTNFSLPDHEPGYPGGIFAPFVPGDLEELKLKEIKNGRLSMVAFVGMVMSAQVTGLNPLAALKAHLDDPLGTNIFGKAVVIPTQYVGPPCAIADSVEFYGITIPMPCFLDGLWP